MFKVITIGDATIDTQIKIDDATVECDFNHQKCHLCLNYAGKIPITDSFQALGGNAANVAVAAQKLSLSTAVVSSIGQDSNGEIILDELKKNNVNVDNVFIDPKTKTRYAVVLNFKGERTILSYHQKRKYDWPKQLPETDWIYYTSLSEGYENLQDKMAAFLNKHQSIRLAFNPGSFQLKNSLDKVKEILPRTDLLFINLEEAELIAGTTLAKEKSIRALLREILIKGVKEVVITNAGQGAWAGNEEEIWQLDSFPVKVLSKTGAGDAFAAGYLSARIYEKDISTALQWGIAGSCAVISAYGPQKNMLDKKGMEKMIAKFADIKPKEL